ncbi:uncharacterized protein EI90DRAFT_3137435 [Cantharellus anzutake]|uniref:uncharacterized protein n=1 Tax=Cantharellus anzutake TaxID=1750568 RepID=UPI0019085C60|nr:uncharacterized protein EI90DRAFT_3137435 [Cantharellus anzutake]KAF8312421.1 hypothetical protein EI90DRAFT_3137435 [Cantharellus anzutake]
MPISKKCKHANNLGHFSQKKKLRTSVPIEGLDGMGSGAFPDHGRFLDGTSGSVSFGVGTGECGSVDLTGSPDSDSNSDIDEIPNPAMSSENTFIQYLHESQTKLGYLANVRGKIPGNKVIYPGKTINSTWSERSLCWDKAKEKEVHKGLQEKQRKTTIDGKKCTIIDFFQQQNPLASFPPNSPVPTWACGHPDWQQPQGTTHHTQPPPSPVMISSQSC